MNMLAVKLFEVVTLGCCLFGSTDRASCTASSCCVSGAKHVVSSSYSAHVMVWWLLAYAGACDLLAVLAAHCVVCKLFDFSAVLHGSQNRLA
jgi:hypothetical protein